MKPVRIEYPEGQPDWLKLPQLEVLVREISGVKCTPLQSKYEVREGLVTLQCEFIGGGNHEYGCTNAIHGEESLVSAALQRLGPEGMKDVALIGIKVKGDGIPQPCGNCRDVLAAYFLNADICDNPELPLVGVSVFEQPAEISAAIYPAQLKDYYVEDFLLHEGALPDAVTRAIQEAAAAEPHAYDIYGGASPRQPRAAALIAAGGIYPGVFIGDAAYHPVGPVAVARAHAYSRGALDIEAAVIIALNRPLVAYRERQYLVEMDPQLPVYMASLSTGQVWATTSGEMLPHHFGAHSIGLSDAVERWKRRSSNR